MLADKRYCYPLTITDFASRYLLCCDALESTQQTYAFTVLERAFKDFGCPVVSAPTTVPPLPAAPPSSVCPSSRSGGCVLVSTSSASNPDTDAERPA
jgi:putative transposase